MDCGGIESWLMNVLRYSNRDYVEHSFLYTLKGGPYYFDSEIERLGSQILHLPCGPAKLTQTPESIS